MRPIHVWRSRTLVGVRCAHFPSVVTTKMDQTVVKTVELTWVEYHVVEPSRIEIWIPEDFTPVTSMIENWKMSFPPRILFYLFLNYLTMRLYHRYLMTRLSLQVVYLWPHVSLTAPPFILWWANLEILFGPLHRSSPFIGELRCQAIQMEHGPYLAERTQNAVYTVTVRCLWAIHTNKPFKKWLANYFAECKQHKSSWNREYLWGMKKNTRTIRKSFLHG
jgi:hypothetical protein